jgi:hypothetical protein
MFELININYTPQQTRQLLLQPTYDSTADALNLFQRVGWFDEEGKYKLYQDTTSQNLIRFAKSCKRTWTSLTNIWERCISSARVEVAIKQCYDEFECTVLNGWVNNLEQGDAIYSAELRQYILTKIQQGINRDINRAIFFGTMDSTDPVAAANPNFNYANGLWTVHLPKLVAENIVPNVATSASALTSGQAVTILRAMAAQAPTAMRSFSNTEKSFFVSSALYQAIQADIESSTFSGGFATQIFTPGGVATGQLYYQGIKIIEMPRWDEIFAADFATPIANYGILTIDKNIAWGIKLADSGAQTRIWTSQDDDTLRAVSKFRIGCDYVAGNMFSIASPVADVI